MFVPARPPGVSLQCGPVTFFMCSARGGDFDLGGSLVNFNNILDLREVAFQYLPRDWFHISHCPQESWFVLVRFA